MKILQTPVRFYPAIGGVEKYALDLSQELAKQDNQVKVLCSDEPKSNLNELNGLKINRLKTFFKIANTNITLSLPFRLLAEKFDIVHTYFPTPWSADWSVLIAKLKAKKAVISYCNDITNNNNKNFIANLYSSTFLKLTLKLADQIIIIGPNYLKTSKYLKKYSTKTKFIPIGVNTNIFHPINIEKEKNTLFFLSVLDEYHKYKGLDYLLEALKIIKEKNKNIKLYIGGKGKLLEYYKAKTKNLGLEYNVKFIGFVPDEKLIEYYNKCEVFVLPSCDSEQEGFGIVLLEALSCNTPVVTTDIVGIANDIRKFNTGVVVGPKNSDELAKALQQILNNSKNYTKNIPNLIAKYNIKKTSQMISDIYQAVLKTNFKNE